MSIASGMSKKVAELEAENERLKTELEFSLAHNIKLGIEIKQLQAALDTKEELRMIGMYPQLQAQYDIVDRQNAELERQQRGMREALAQGCSAQQPCGDPTHEALRKLLK